MTEPRASLASLATALTNRYDIVRELGRGGSATVYLATDRKHDRPVAMKVLHALLDAALSHDRFLAEIRTTARLQHPHILPLYDSGEADGRLFFTMPYVEGEALRERLRRETRIPVDDAMRIAGEVAAALEYAHARGIIHRDIKPENIMLSTTGHALVADFGIAYAVDEARSLIQTDPGMVVGTPAYMSPEHAEGVRDLDGRSDMFALACVMYEMLVGALPVESDTPHAAFTRRIRQPVPSIFGLCPGVSRSVDRALQRALCRDPAARFQSMTEFVAAIRQAGSFEVATFGGLSVRADGRLIRDAKITPAGLACLAVVAHAGDTGVSRRRLISLVWESEVSQDAEWLLDRTLGDIAAALGTTEAIAGTDILVLDSDLADSDVARFAAALVAGRFSDAARLYRGAFLEGFSLPGAPAFERWAGQVRAELALENAAVLEKLARDAERSAHYADAVRWWKKLSAQDPLNGRLTLELMRAMAASGDRAAAMAQARIYEALIEQEVSLPIDRAVVSFADDLGAGHAPDYPQMVHLAASTFPTREVSIQ